MCDATRRCDWNVVPALTRRRCGVAVRPAKQAGSPTDGGGSTPLFVATDHHAAVGGAAPARRLARKLPVATVSSIGRPLPLASSAFRAVQREPHFGASSRARSPLTADMIN